MKTFKTLLEEISTQEEEELSLEDTDLISDVVEKIKEIVDGASESNANEIVDDLEAAIAPFNLTFDKEEALEALESDEPTELALHVANGEEDPFVISAEDEGEEIPGEMVLALHKDGDGIYAKIHVYFDDPEPEPLDDIKFHVPDEDESEEEKEKEKQEEGNYEDYPADEDKQYDVVDGERSTVGGKTNTMGGVEEEEEEEDEEEDEDECECEDKENCTCKKKKKEEGGDTEAGGEYQARLSGAGADVTRKGAIEVYESKFYEMHSSKYACVHIKNHKLKVDILDHPLDAYHMGLNVVGKVLEIKPQDVHETYARMQKLRKEDQAINRAKKKKIQEKMKVEMLKDSTVESPVATGKKSPVINDIMNKDDQEKFKKKMEVHKESLPAANTSIVKKLKKKTEKEEKTGEDLPEPGTYQV